jgi:hypothetical protein
LHRVLTLYMGRFKPDQPMKPDHRKPFCDFCLGWFGYGSKPQTVREDVRSSWPPAAAACGLNNRRRHLTGGGGAVVSTKPTVELARAAVAASFAAARPSCPAAAACMVSTRCCGHHRFRDDSDVRIHLIQQRCHGASVPRRGLVGRRNPQRWAPRPTPTLRRPQRHRSCRVCRCHLCQGSRCAVRDGRSLEYHPPRKSRRSARAGSFPPLRGQQPVETTVTVGSKP